MPRKFEITATELVKIYLEWVTPNRVHVGKDRFGKHLAIRKRWPNSVAGPWGKLYEAKGITPHTVEHYGVTVWWDT